MREGRAEFAVEETKHGFVAGEIGRIAEFEFGEPSCFLSHHGRIELVFDRCVGDPVQKEPEKALRACSVAQQSVAKPFEIDVACQRFEKPLVPLEQFVLKVFAVVVVGQ